MEGTSSILTGTGECVVTNWPIPYDPIFDLEKQIDSISDNRAGLKLDLKETLEFYQLEIGLMTRIKEQAKNYPEIQNLCQDIISMELSLIKFIWMELSDL